MACVNICCAPETPGKWLFNSGVMNRELQVGEKYTCVSAVLEEALCLCVFLFAFQTLVCHLSFPPDQWVGFCRHVLTVCLS